MSIWIAALVCSSCHCTSALSTSSTRGAVEDRAWRRRPCRAPLAFAGCVCRPRCRRRTSPGRRPTRGGSRGSGRRSCGDGTPSGLRMTSTGVPSSRNGMSCSSTIFEMTPLLPWRPASLSPSEILRFLATNTRTRSLTPGRQVVAVLAQKVMTSMTTPPSPWGTFSEVSRTSRAFSLKIARISFSSAVSSVSPFGVTLPTSRSPEPTSAPTRTMPRSSRLRSDSSERFGMSRVISSSPSFVVRASISYSSMWIEVSSSSLTRRLREDDRVLEVVALPGHEGDHQVLAQRHLAVVGRRAVGEHLAGLDGLAGAHQRLLVDQRALVGAAGTSARMYSSLPPSARLDVDRSAST